MLCSQTDGLGSSYDRLDFSVFIFFLPNKAILSINLSIKSSSFSIKSRGKAKDSKIEPIFWRWFQNLFFLFPVIYCTNHHTKMPRETVVRSSLSGTIHSRATWNGWRNWSAFFETEAAVVQRVSIHSICCLLWKLRTSFLDSSHLRLVEIKTR